MKNVSKIILDDVKVEEVVDRLAAEGQEEIIGVEENQLSISFENDSEELVKLLLQDTYSDELVGQEDSFIIGQESSFAQTLLNPDEEEGPSSPIETDPTGSIVDTLGGNTLGGGGLSHLSAAPFSDPLSNEALPGETTASSTVSGIQGISTNDGSATVDGLFGINFENRDFGFEGPPPVEVARVDNTLAEEVAPVVEEICNAEDDVFTVMVGEGFFTTISYSSLLSNDDAGLNIVSVQGNSIPTSGNFNVTDGATYNAFVELNTGFMEVYGGADVGASMTLSYLTDGGCSADITINFVSYSEIG